MWRSNMLNFVRDEPKSSVSKLYKYYRLLHGGPYILV